MNLIRRLGSQAPLTVVGVIVALSIMLVSRGLGVPTAQTLPTAAAEELGLSSERLARLEAYMQREVEQNRIAGMVTLIARSGRIVHLKTYGRRTASATFPCRPTPFFGLHR
jgi:hypothetical protein